MVRPLTVASWATDAVFAAADGVDPLAVGHPTRLAPTSGEAAQGWVPGLGFVGDVANYVVGNLCDNVAWLSGRIDNGGDFNYETARTRRMAIPMSAAHGFGDLSTPDWTLAHGYAITSLNDGAEWFVPIRGIPIGAQVLGINVRGHTNNALRSSGNRAFMEVVRFSYQNLLDVTHSPPDYNSGPAPLWEMPFLNGFPGPGPYHVPFPAFAGDLFAGVYQPFFIVDEWSYALRIKAGTDPGGHVSDVFNGVAIDWRDFGPRSGG